MIKVILGRLGVIFESFRILIVLFGIYLGGGFLPLPAITTNSLLLPVLISIVVIVLLLMSSSSHLLLWSILGLPLRFGSYRLILWKITSGGHSIVAQILSDLWSLSLSPLLLLILSDHHRHLLMKLILLGVILTHYSIVMILGVLIRLAPLFTFLITIVIEAIASSSAALGGV